MSIFEQLAAPFPKEKIHWRAQSVAQKGKNAGKAAMALAYLDARDVMNRLDAAVGMGGWQAEHYDAGGGKLGCKIGIQCGGEWIWKSDGAGETQVEAEKGAFSGALKRAAVMWGIGRYLYDLPAPWVPCETEERGGKFYFKKWTADPWSYCGNADLSVHESPASQKPIKTEKKEDIKITELKQRARDADAELKAITDEGELDGFIVGYATLANDLKKHLPDWHDAYLAAIEGMRKSFKPTLGAG